MHNIFIELLKADLCHSQLITEPTHKNGKILDLLFTNITCSRYARLIIMDKINYGFKIKSDVPMKKMVKRKVYNYSTADWRALNFDIRKIDWELYIGMHDQHECWPLFQTVLERLCGKQMTGN